MLDDLRAQIRNAVSPGEVREAIAEGIRALGFNHYSLIDAGDYGDDNSRVYFSNNPVGWVEHYIENNYQMADPLLAAARRRVLPFTWAEIQAEEPLSRLQLKMFEAAAEFGNHSGGTVPVHGPHGAFTMMTLSSSLSPADFDLLWRQRLPELLLLAVTLQAAARRWTEAKVHHADDALEMIDARLTRREAECLLWSARGKTAADVAAILDISENTVREHFRRCSRKLNSSSLVQTVSTAIVSGLITP